MSSFGADQNDYTAEDVFEIIIEEVTQVLAKDPVQCSLESVQVVYPKRKHVGLWRSISFRTPGRSLFRARSRYRSTFRVPTRVTPTKRKISFASKFGSVSVVLREGKITTHEADVIVNILPTDVQRSSYNNVCENIIQAGGQSVQDEVKRHTRSKHPRSIFITNAGSIEKVKEILHIIPELLDKASLRSSLEQCFDFVKASSFRYVLFPVAENMFFDVSLECLVHIILDIAKNFGTDDLATLEIAVLVAQMDELDVLKSLFEEQSVTARSASLRSANSSVTSNLQDVDDVFLESSEIKIPADERREDNILLRFVGLRSNVDDSISEVMDFVDRNKAKQSIQISSKNIKFCLDRMIDLNNFASIFHVLITLEPQEITIEGVIKDNVFECHKKITDLLNKHAKIEDERKQKQLGKSNDKDSHMTKLEDDDNSSDDVYLESSGASWPWEKKSKTHEEKFKKFIKYGLKNPKQIKKINGVRFCPSKKFCIGRGSDGTRVYIGLGKDGYEKAVKRVHKDQCGSLAKQEKNILNEPSTQSSTHTVKYWGYDDESDNEFVHLILELCEETLEEYVKRKSHEDLLEVAPDVICQILDGLNDLHQKPTTILHRDLKPSNIMRNVQDKWLLADFGISRTLPPDQNTLVSKQRGNDHWIAVESHSSEELSDECHARYKKESDIQTAGMVAFFIVSKGEHPFGSKKKRIINLQSGNPVGLSNIKDPVLNDLLGWMLSHSSKERPSAKEARKHPYLLSAREQFELLCTLGNVFEIKSADPTCDVTQQINNDTTNWISLLDDDVYQYLCTVYNSAKKSTHSKKYSPEWTHCLRFIRNADQHWKDPKPILRPKSIECEPQDYFLKIFPNLPVTMHKILRSCDWREREEFKRFFT